MTTAAAPTRRATTGRRTERLTRAVEPRARPARRRRRAAAVHRRAGRAHRRCCGSCGPLPSDPTRSALAEAEAEADGSADFVADGLGLAEAPDAVMVSAMRCPYPTAAL